jgi:twitching motility protein PilT
MDETLLSILRGAVEAGASDIHLKAGGPVTFRVNGALLPVDAPLPSDEWLSAALRDMVPAHLQDRLAQEHEVDFAFHVPELSRFRVNAYQQRGRATIALRVVKTQLRGFAELNLPDTVRQISEAPRGIVIIAGAIGSGKSTTLAAMIEHVNRTARKHVITLEDPIEYLFEDKQSLIDQREVGLDTASFRSGLRHVLRQDPDIIVIGEMRDAESAAAAMSAANIGHLVITTLHTADAPGSVQRVLEFFPPEQREYARHLFAATLHAVVCQRLVRTTTGGMLPALEILLNNAGVAKLIENDHPEQLSATMEMSAGDGMQTFDQALMRMVHEGKISRDVALAHAGNPEGLRMSFQGVVLSDSRRILGSRG